MDRELEKLNLDKGFFEPLFPITDFEELTNYYEYFCSYSRYDSEKSACNTLLTEIRM